MTWSVLITRTAERDLDRAADHIEFVLKNPAAADSLLDEAARTAALARMPERWPRVEDKLLSAAGIRRVRVKNYLLFYTVSHAEKTVTVLRFLYGRSDWINLLRQDFGHA